MPFGLGKKKAKLGSNAPDGPGQVNLPNPGEYPADGDTIGLRRNTVGAFPTSGHRAGGGPTGRGCSGPLAAVSHQVWGIKSEARILEMRASLLGLMGDRAYRRACCRRTKTPAVTPSSPISPASHSSHPACGLPVCGIPT